jgi:hypothetical protein
MNSSKRTEASMKASTQIRPGTRNRERVLKLPLPLFHAPLAGEELELFSDRTEDLVEYDSIMHEFELLHDSDVGEAAGGMWV